MKRTEGGARKEIGEYKEGERFLGTRFSLVSEGIRCAEEGVRIDGGSRSEVSKRE